MHRPPVSRTGPNLASCTTGPPALPSQPTCGSPASRRIPIPPPRDAVLPHRETSSARLARRQLRHTEYSYPSLTPAIASWPPRTRIRGGSAHRDKAPLPDEPGGTTKSLVPRHGRIPTSLRPPSPCAAPANHRAPFLGEPDLPESRSCVNGPALAPGRGVTIIQGSRVQDEDGVRRL